MRWLGSKEEGTLFALPKAALCLEGEDYTLPQGLCSMGWTGEDDDSLQGKARQRAVTKDRQKHQPSTEF